MSEQQMAPATTRFVRQQDFVPPTSLDELPITIIGCGAIGRQVATQLASIGARDITLIDFDSVTETNVTTQGFMAADVGKEKVFAVEEAIKAIDPDVKVTAICDRFRPKMEISGVVFVCVDTMDARLAIWKAIQGKVGLLLDGRMLGEAMRVLASFDYDSAQHYESTLCPQSEVLAGRCTGHATIYCATIAAGLMTHQMTRYLRGMALDPDMSLNLLAGELAPCS